MDSSKICILIAILVYMILVVGIGFYYSKKNKNADDFYLGGRKLGPFVTAMSAEASDMSSWLLMGLPGLAYATGICDVGWTAIGLAVGTYLNWLIVSKRVRKYSQINNATTIPAFFTNRFKDKSNILAVIAALVIIIFFVPYTASGFAACGKLFSSLFGVDYVIAMLICAVVIVAYTTIGGFMAASTSDFLQSEIMTMALAAVVIYMVVNAGGFDTMSQNLSTLPGYFRMDATYIAETNSASPYGPLKIVSTLAWGLGYFGMPHILLRFMAIEDANKLKLSRRVASVWVVIAMGIAVLIGVAGLGMVKNGTLSAETVADPERIIVYIADMISQHGVIAALLAGVILAGILAATMSTADSQLLAAASSASQNIIKETFCKNISEKTVMIIARVSVLMISVVAAFLALDPDSSVFKIVSFAWAGFGAAFGPAMLMMLFWRRVNKWGVLAGMVSGGVMVFVWKFGIANISPAFNVYELLPAFIISLVCIIVVSLLTPAPSQDVLDEFDKAKAMK